MPRERQFLDYRAMVQSDIDGVIVCPSGSHAAPSIAAAEAGKHVLVEKPMCTTVAEAEAMVAAADKAGTILMVAYMKRHEPAYQFAQARVREMSDVRFIQVNHLHPDNDLHTAEFKVHRFDDLPAGVREASHARARTRSSPKRLATRMRAPLPRDMHHAYNLILGSMIHDIGNLHGLFGPPRRVLSAEIWRDGRAVSTVLDYGDGKRAVCSLGGSAGAVGLQRDAGGLRLPRARAGLVPDRLRARAAVVRHAARHGRRTARPGVGSTPGTTTRSSSSCCTSASASATGRQPITPAARPSPTSSSSATSSNVPGTKD